MFLLPSELPPKDLCRELGIHEQTLYVWKRKYGGLEPEKSPV
jgi:transposase-like protein